jgi:hypothetical protein
MITASVSAVTVRRATQLMPRLTHHNSAQLMMTGTTISRFNALPLFTQPCAKAERGPMGRLRVIAISLAEYRRAVPELFWLRQTGRSEENASRLPCAVRPVNAAVSGRKSCFAVTCPLAKTPLYVRPLWARRGGISTASVSQTIDFAGVHVYAKAQPCAVRLAGQAFLLPSSIG